MNIPQTRIFLSSLAVFALSLGVYFIFLKLFHFTFIATGNGAYKALQFFDWLNNNGEIEKANCIYFPLIKIFTKLFEVKKPIDAYYTIVFINGFFSSALLSFIFAYITINFHSFRLALVSVCIHFLMRGYFVLSTGNEDIFPSYALFVMGALFFRNFTIFQNTWYFFVALICFCLSTLLHWTSGIPIFGGLIFYFIFIDKKTFSQKLLLAILSIFVIASIFKVSSAITSIPLKDIFYPAKESSSLWASKFTLETIVLSILNTPIFMLFGVSLPDLEVVRNFWPFLLITLIFCFLLGWAFKKVAARRGKSFFYNGFKNEISFICFLLMVLFIGTAMNAYEQGSDLQFFIQPVFIFYILIVFILNELLDLKLNSLFYVLFGIISLVNIIIIFFTKDFDKSYFSELTTLEQKNINTSNTLFLSASFESFHVIARLMASGSNDLHFMDLSPAEIQEHQLADTSYLKIKQDVIENALSNNFNIVVLNFLNEDPSKVGKIFKGYDFSQKMKLIKNYLSENFEAEEIKNTGRNKFFLLHKKMVHP